MEEQGASRREEAGGSPPHTHPSRAGLPYASLAKEGKDLVEPGGRNNVGQVPAELREKPGPVSLSELSQVQKSNLLVTLPAPRGNFLNSSDLSYLRCPESCGERMKGFLLNSQLPTSQGGQWVKAGLTTLVVGGGQYLALSAFMET